ncbi:MAG TPA: hypothetical protein VMQ38_11965 [Mycobacterium sp.]|nr:hypothetical protein [Mycobacterium sp.]
MRSDGREALVNLLARSHRWREEPLPVVGHPQTPPSPVVNTRASRPLPTIRAASSSASDAGNGTERRS